MNGLWKIDWHTLFVPSGSLLELIIRGSITYLLMIALIRALRREGGQMGVADVLVIVIIADAAQNGMSGPYNSITEGIVLICTIMLWDYVLDWLSFRSASVRRLLRPNPLLLVRDGRVQAKNLRRALISEEELLGRLREEGMERIVDVKHCYLEGDGHISIISRATK